MRPVLSRLRSRRGLREAEPRVDAGGVVEAAPPARSVEGLNPIPGLVEKFVAEGQLLLHSPDGYYLYEINPIMQHPFVTVAWRGTPLAVVTGRVPIANPWFYVNDNSWRAFLANANPIDERRLEVVAAVCAVILADIPFHISVAAR